MRALGRLSLSLLLLAIGVNANAAAKNACSRVQLRHRPAVANSGAWTANGELLIADALEKVLLLYGKSGRALGTIPEPIGSTLGKFYPQNVRSQQDRIFLETQHGGLMVLDQDYVPLTSKDVHAKSARLEMKGESIESLFLWEPVGNDIISFSDLKDPKNPQNPWKSGFVRFPVDRPQDFTVLKSQPYEASSRTFYQLAQPYIASLGNTGYVLLMDKQMQIAKETKGKLEPIHAFPEGLDRKAPSLPKFFSFDDLVPVMSAVERSTMPTGLYGWEGSLFVLWRKVEGRTTARWYLTKIDPQADRVVGTVSIATSASHLSVVPGPESWAFIEKGPMRAVGVQDIGTLLLVPAERLRSAFKGGSDLCQ
jgi:hypothetical protein